MHIPDGFLAPTITLPAYIVAAPLWLWAARKHFGPGQVDALPAIGALTAVAFVLQTIMIPLPGGTSTHLVGASLLALLRGPLVAFLCESLVLLLQALFFGAGGITVLGVNALAMGLGGPLVAWLVFRFLQRRAPRVGAFLAAYLGLQVSTVLVVLIMSLQNSLDPSQFPTPLPVMFVTMMLPSLAITGILEALYTLFALRVLARARGKSAP
ncbi:MAG TPA: energy-coupling factor ABC transporter permease [Polyangia bacterium]